MMTLARALCMLARRVVTVLKLGTVKTSANLPALLAAKAVVKKEI